MNIENHKNFEGFIRAFWRRVHKHKNDYESELPEDMPIEFKCAAGTASILLRLDVAAWQYRYTEVNEGCVDFGDTTLWTHCDKQKFDDINISIKSGHTHYETRELYA